MNSKDQIKVKINEIDQALTPKKSRKPIQLTNTSKNSETKFNDNQEPIITDKKILDQVGLLTRNLHNSLRELGYDTRLQEIASEVPDAQDKLAYVATKTEQAAERTLNATEIAMPIQDKLSNDAIYLSEQWKKAFETQQANSDPEVFKTLLIETLQYLDKVPEQTSTTNAQLLEIMMAQDFQDLTGQVIKKITHMVQSLEKDLIDLLLANAPAKKITTEHEGLMNGPVTNPEKRNDVVCNQNQADDLLASLGF
ncbi:protein phosphatase CheZ [Nitrosomonas sp.]|uniref:protein phosphatase CheZ n=1 Tax=Nitrosomonas sp. TaxID=42353 RepID=UPI0025E8E7CB|nr:protein phosphatase CheZ [Nitrosomonas sp.]